ncbi:hypothetical protein QYE88_42295, partial [Enterobacter hormaechei subsp. steigerwaltii]|nr:hypothetical protein [Enterobacter hormaechei subsp. steigerwaltii]
MKIGERGRNSVRGREAMAGCRGAALTRVFVMPAYVTGSSPVRGAKFEKPAFKAGFLLFCVRSVCRVALRLPDLHSAFGKIVGWR